MVLPLLFDWCYAGFIDKILRYLSAPRRRRRRAREENGLNACNSAAAECGDCGRCELRRLTRRAVTVTVAVSATARGTPWRR